MDKYTVILVDDHKLFREGLRMLLGNFAFIGDIHEAADAHRPTSQKGDVYVPVRVDLAGAHERDVDAPVMNGIEATARAVAAHPELNIIGLSMFGEEDYYTRMIESGVKGFILKNSGIQEVEAAITHVMDGKNYFSQEIMDGILKNMNKKSRQSTAGLLTEREEEILYHICRGLSNNEIAEHLHISKRTVDKHRENLLLKTNSKNTAGLVMFAIRHGIVEV